MTIELRLLNLLQNRLPFNINDYTNFNTYLAQFKYPIGALASIFSITRNKDNHYSYSYQEEYDYFYNIINSFYQEYYTQKEIEIICYYFVSFFKGFYDTDMLIQQKIVAAMNYSDNKKEIQLIQTYLKYHYTKFLIIEYPYKNNEIQQLLTELENQEENLDPFILYSRINELS